MKEMCQYWNCWGELNERTGGATARRAGDRGTLLLGKEEILPWKQKFLSSLLHPYLIEALDIIIIIYYYFINLITSATKTVVLKHWTNSTPSFNPPLNHSVIYRGIPIII